MLREHVPQHVRGQSEQQAAENGWHEPTRQLTAQQVGGSRREHDREKNEGVVGDQRPREEGEWSGQE